MRAEIVSVFCFKRAPVALEWNNSNSMMCAFRLTLAKFFSLTGYKVTRRIYNHCQCLCQKQSVSSNPLIPFISAEYQRQNEAPVTGDAHRLLVGVDFLAQVRRFAAQERPLQPGNKPTSWLGSSPGVQTSLFFFFFFCSWTLYMCFQLVGHPGWDAQEASCVGVHSVLRKLGLQEMWSKFIKTWAFTDAHSCCIVGKFVNNSRL